MTQQGEHPALPLNLPSFEVRQSLRDQILHALRAALIAGEMRPGVVYSAPALAAQFGVSPTPVREAMLHLAKEGLVEILRNKGFRVTAMSDRDLDELTEIRALIEVPTVGKLAANVSPDQFEKLRPLANAIVAAAERRDLVTYVDADLHFHTELLRLAGNEHLVDVVHDLRKRSRLYGLPSLAERGELLPSALEHGELLDILATGDVRGAESLMRRHIAHVRGIWANRPEPSRR